MSTKKPIKAKPLEKNDSSLLSLLFILLYALVELFPQLKAVDVMGSQWLFLSVLNLVVSAYLIRRKLMVSPASPGSWSFLLLGGFLLVALLSFFVTYNQVESLVTYSRLLIASIAFVNITFICIDDTTLIRKAMIAIALVLIAQSLYELFHFLDSIKSRKPLDELIINLRGNTGNKNFLGAGMLLRIPFLLVLMHDRKLWVQASGAVGMLAGVSTLFIVNSRSTFVGLFLLTFTYIAIHILLAFRNKDKNILKLPALHVALIAIAFVFTQSLFSKIERLSKKGSYGTVAERLSSISFSNEGSSGRVRLWESAIDFIGKHPLLGGGYGNWKIHSIPYEASTIRGFGLRKHVHNDYLEVTAETGIAGGLLYSGFILIIAFFGLRLFLKKELPGMLRYAVLGLMLSQIAYLSDSLFNFPLERPNMFLHMMFNAAAITSLHMMYLSRPADTKQSATGMRSLPIISIVVSLPLLWISWQCYLSMAAQNTIAIEWFGMPKTANPPFKSDVVNPMFPEIPNLNELGMPISCMKAKYLAQEGKNDAARAELEKGNSANPHLYFAEFILTNMAISENKLDSAQYFAKKAYYNRPANQQVYELLYNICTELKDTAEMQKAFRTKTKTRPEGIDYARHAETFYRFNEDFSMRRETLRQGLKRLPNDPMILFQQAFTEGLILADRNDHAASALEFAKAMKYKDDPQAALNAGLEFLATKNYDEAEPWFSKAVASGKFSNGLPEYGLGLCYFNRNRLEEACPYIKAAMAKGYQADGKVAARCGL